MNRYQSEDEIEKVVRAFETCETGADDFKHAEHLVVAVWYLHTMDRDGALDRMRAGLLRFLDHYEGNTSKYSETVTVFYIDKIADKLNELGSEVSIVEKCNAVLATDFRRSGS
ncbi:MAG TPA: hypothetical protein VKB05_01950 [Pyrinomonadaceae bacterium]|nr:hypothetical protein [Pyrinomonadaceae bacterium]